MKKKMNGQKVNNFSYFRAFRCDKELYDLTEMIPNVSRFIREAILREAERLSLIEWKLDKMGNVEWRSLVKSKVKLRPPEDELRAYQRLTRKKKAKKNNHK